MPLMLMSNPLSLALLGNPGRRKKRRKAKFGFPSRKRFTQARWRAKRRVGRRYRIKGGSAYRVVSVKVGSRRRAGRKIHRSGISWSGRLGGVRYRGAIRRRGARRYARATWTNPRRRRTKQRNPMKAIRGYVSALKSAPKDITGLFKGPKKIKHIAFAAGGAVGTYLASNIFVPKVLTPALALIPGASGMFANPIAARVVGGLVPFTLGYVASKFVKGDIGKSLLVGGAVASLVEVIKPGLLQSVIFRTPVVAQVAATVPAAAATPGPVSGLLGLGAYVDSPAYQGVGAYVDSPAYQGVGAYVDSPAYQGVGDADDDLAGVPEMAGMGDYLDEGKKYLDSYLAN